jgi:hypothetical protein
MPRWIAFLMCQLPASAGLICFYGADLAQRNAKDFAKDIVGLYQAANPDAKTGVGTDIKASGLFDDMLTKLAGCYDAAAKKFKCDGGVLLVYISADGAYTGDQKDTVIGNLANPGNIKVSDLAAAIAPAIPECCTLIFAFDSCAADGWYGNFIDPGDKEVNPNNPFQNLNWAVFTPKIQPNGKCLGTPVGDGLKKAFQGKKKTTVKELVTFMSGQPGVEPRYGLDDDHGGYQLIADAGFPPDPDGPVPVPESVPLWLPAVALLAVTRLRSPA